MLATWSHQDEPNKAFLSNTPSPGMHISVCFWSSSGCLHLVTMALCVYTNNKQGKNCCPFPDSYYLEFQAKCLGVQLCTPEMVRKDKSKPSSLHFESRRLIFFLNAQKSEISQQYQVIFLIHLATGINWA